MTVSDELTRWALAAPLDLEKSRRVGAERVRLVLLALVQYANEDLVAWPSAETLAEDVYGMTRRDVRPALELLEKAGYITPARPKRPGVTTRWRIVLVRDEDLAGNLAGTPARSEPAPEAPQDPPNLAGPVAGDLAGNLAGTPATNQNQNQNHTTPAVGSVPQRDSRATALAVNDDPGWSDVALIDDPRTRVVTDESYEAAHAYLSRTLGTEHAGALVAAYMAENIDASIKGAAVDVARDRGWTP